MSSDFENHLKVIIDNIDEDTIKGIAKRAIDIGFDNLSDRQKEVLENGIEDYIMKDCPNCGENISYEDMAIAIDNNMCSYCQYKWEKMQAE